MSGWLLTDRTPNTHTHTHTLTHTLNLLRVSAGRKAQPLGQGPVEGSRGQRRSPQFQIQPAVSYWPGKIQPQVSTPSAAFKPNSSTSLCVLAYMRFPLTLTLLHSCSTRNGESRRKRDRDTEKMDNKEVKARIRSLWAKWITHWHPIGQAQLFWRILEKVLLHLHLLPLCHWALVLELYVNSCCRQHYIKLYSNDSGYF